MGPSVPKGVEAVFNYVPTTPHENMVPRCTFTWHPFVVFYFFPFLVCAHWPHPGVGNETPTGCFYPLLTRHRVCFRFANWFAKNPQISCGKAVLEVPSNGRRFGHYWPKRSPQPATNVAYAALHVLLPHFPGNPTLPREKETRHLTIPFAAPQGYPNGAVHSLPPRRQRNAMKVERCLGSSNLQNKGL